MNNKLKDTKNRGNTDGKKNKTKDDRRKEVMAE
jgi:hypothetical protein